jgi:hypothetical protein
LFEVNSFVLPKRVVFRDQHGPFEVLRKATVARPILDPPKLAAMASRFAGAKLYEGCCAGVGRP